MFKTLFKARHERKSVGAAQRPPGGPTYGYNAPEEQQQQQRMQEQNGGGPSFNDLQGPPVSCVPVEYAMSPPTPLAGGYQTQSPMTQPPVEYHKSPPVDNSNNPRHNISAFSTGPAVEYTASAPSMPFQPFDRDVSMGPAVEYKTSAPIRDPRTAPQNAPTARQQPRYPPYPMSPAPSSNNQGYQVPPARPFVAELPAQQTYSPRGKFTAWT